MIRVMRKILKRKVCIVMALLVILGIAVYGVSAFADGESTSTVTLDKGYIYLNPTNMKASDTYKSSPDWTDHWTDQNTTIIYIGIKYKILLNSCSW